MAKSPLAIMKDKFGDKKKLVAAVEAFTTDDLWVSRTNKDKGLAHVSNAKLIRLLTTFTAVKEKFGTRAKLIEAILEVEKRVKDDGYRKHLSEHPVPRLWDLYKSAAKRNAPAAPRVPRKAAVKGAAPAKKTAAKKAAPAKKAAAKKPASKGKKK
ncbi:MAG TPA: hypothetical protein VGI39_44730 [Polyangiaceae bacterium]|jgi:hypothetical protein